MASPLLVAEPDGLIAVRAHQAKHVSDCALCPELIGMRERVVGLPGGGWAHLFCVVPRPGGR